MLPTNIDCRGHRRTGKMTLMTALDARITEVPESDWELWRDLRLAALSDAPGAFGATLAGARAQTEDDWRAWWRAEPSTPRFLATLAGVPLGMCALVLPADHDYQPLVISMWVVPSARGGGLARALLDACVRWSSDHGYGRLRLGVAQDNESAARLYVRFGFNFTGEAEPLLSNPRTLLKWMELPLNGKVAQAAPAAGAVEAQ